MGKVKSSVITAIICVAIVVLAFFATVSFNLPGSVKRYNSFLSSIHLGSDLTGESYALLYPEGVISSASYNLVVNDGDSSEKEDYEKTYEAHGGLYVDKEKSGSELIESVRADAEIIRDRLGEKGYSAFSVTVEDDYVIKVSVPSDYTYSAYTKNNTTSRSDSVTLLSHAIQYLTLGGELKLCDGTSGDTVLKSTENFGSYFKEVDHYQLGGTHAVRLVLTDDGLAKINALLEKSDSSNNAVIYVGDTSLGFQFKYGEPLTDNTLMFQADESNAADFAILMESVRSGNVIGNTYNDDGINSTSIISVTSTFGEYAAIYLFVALLLVVIGAIAYSSVKYKKLGFVCALSILSYALAVIICALLMEIQITIAGAFTAVLGLALLVFSNYIAFEAIRKETALGRTMQAAVKVGYKKSLFTILDLHVVTLIVAIVAALAGFGEVTSCGVILFVATIASYVLYWFTRFMWYVVSSPAKDKFKFCGFKREDLEDDD